jgi:hypothetical protein
MKKTNHEKKNNLCKSLLAVFAITVLTLPGLTLAQQFEFSVEDKDAAYTSPIWYTP